MQMARMEVAVGKATTNRSSCTFPGGPWVPLVPSIPGGPCGPWFPGTPFEPVMLITVNVAVAQLPDSSVALTVWVPGVV